MNAKYQKTIIACFTGFIVQAIVNNFVPLLFVTFHQTYKIPLYQITFLVTINFGIQLGIDLLSVTFVDRIGYRASMIVAHAASALGLIFLAVLPDLLSSPYIGIMIAIVFYAVGGGLLEVLVSPVMEACPTDNKEAAMSLLHSFYCWGHVGVVLISTLFFTIFGIHNWKYLAIIWAMVPIANMVAFIKVPIASLTKEGERGMTAKELITSKLFWILMLLMVCAGACEQSVSQWASTFAEQGLGVSKTIGDLAGPMFFAIMMGTSRGIYGKFGDKLSLEKTMAGCAFLCLGSYLLISLSPVPAISLLGCGICGFSVGIMWPGTFSIAAKSMPKSTALYALLALGGDLGCLGGPTYVGVFSSLFHNNLHIGILFAIVFPILLILGLSMQKQRRKSKQ